MVFHYDSESVEHLKLRDPVLGAAIEAIGPIEREVTPDLFGGLVSSIIAQQISSKAARTVWERFKVLVVDVTPERVAAFDVESIQKQGMSLRKAGYIKSIAESVLSGTFDIEGLSTLSDDRVKSALKGLPGIGVWTAEMLMLFSMQRQDILSWDDLAIRRGMMRLYGLESLDRKTFEHYRGVYSPFGSVASLYLWAISARDGFALST